MPTLRISLPESLRAFVDQQVASRHYENPSEFIRALIRDAEEREAEQARSEALLLIVRQEVVRC